jgi:hypothetical protein
MNNSQLRRWTGILFIVGALLVNIPYTLLIMNFEYPQILRQETGEILSRFQAGGTGLIWQWFAFAWIGLPILVAVILFQKVMKRENNALVPIATFFGATALVAQIIGLLRWVFVVPILSGIYNNPNSTPAAKEAATVSFEVIHQLGGVLLGEHIGQTFTIVWMVLISKVMIKSAIFKPWLGWFGLGAAAVYLAAQTELFETVIPGFPVVSIAGLLGSLLWLVWLILIGVALLRSKDTVSTTNYQEEQAFTTRVG